MILSNVARKLIATFGEIPSSIKSSNGGFFRASQLTLSLLLTELEGLFISSQFEVEKG
jgi:hypothetical protein